MPNAVVETPTRALGTRLPSRRDAFALGVGGMHRRRRRSSSSLRLHGLAAARGRDARALHRAQAARRRARHRARPARRRSAPLPLRLGRRPPRRRADGPARWSRRLRRREHPARRAARRAPRRARDGARRDGAVARAGCSLFHGVYGRMYSIFLFTSVALVPRAAARARARRPARAGRSGRSRSCSASPRIRTARSCSPRRRCTCCRARGAAARGALRVRGRRSSLGDPVLAHGSRARLPVRRRRRRRRREARHAARRAPVPARDAAGDFIAG